MMLKEILIREGRSQTWLRLQLGLKGITRDHSQIHRWCWNKSKPRDVYVINTIASILSLNPEEIERCFEKGEDDLIF